MSISLGWCDEEQDMSTPYNSWYDQVDSRAKPSTGSGWPQLDLDFFVILLCFLGLAWVPWSSVIVFNFAI